MAARSAKDRIKYGYLNYSDIQDRIDGGKLDAYDIVYTKDTHECYILTEDLLPVAIKSKVYRFDGVSAAINFLNQATDTYEGQIVSIKTKGRYKAYIVNLIDEQYDVTLLSELDEEIDYNTLGNKPIINMVGSLAEPIVIGNLDNGVYSITGQYKLYDSVETIYSSSSNHLFLVDKSEIDTQIREVSARKISTYSNTDGTFKEVQIATSDYLAENKYMTESDVDNKIQVFDILTKTEAKEYIESIVADYLDGVLDDKIDQKLDEKIVEPEDSTIDEMFNTTE